MVDAIAAGAASSLSESDGDIWKRLWKLFIVPKVRVFFWCRGILPGYETLTRRHVMENSTYGLCKVESKTLMHALIECNHAKLF
jgi:hypothetical protein